MRINLMPLYAWYLLVVGGMILFAFPPLIAGDILFELERVLDWPFFDPARGGDPVLWQHLFWIFGHPEVYIVFLPAIALLFLDSISRKVLHAKDALRVEWLCDSAAVAGTGLAWCPRTCRP